MFNNGPYILKIMSYVCIMEKTLKLRNLNFLRDLKFVFNNTNHFINDKKKIKVM